MVDLLVGGNFYWHFMIDEIPIRGPGPVATKSRLGYLISGSPTEVSVEGYSHSTILTVITGEESNLERLRSLEAFGIFGEGKFGQQARDYVKQSIEYRNDKYVAKFPWKADHPTLPSNYNIIRNMTRATIRKLAKKPELLSLFDRLIRHQLENEFIEKVPDADLNKICHYIPYHYVTKDSSTTPLRIVYNCSQKGWNGVSFNDCVETGPALHNDQSSILIRFRTFAIGIVADVEKAFYHVGLNESDRDFLRWFWLKDPTNPDSELIIFRFKVVPFGAKSSPFMPNATIWRHLGTVASPVAADMLRSIYVDNVISGCDSRQEALNYYKSANEVMERAYLPLQSWGFCDRVIEEQLLPDGRLDESPVSKTLGLLWDRRDDTLHVQNVNLSPLYQETATKRDVLKGVASFYDPLGMYTPLSIRVRVLLQILHRDKIKLDDRLSQQHLEL